MTTEQLPATTIKEKLFSFICSENVIAAILVLISFSIYLTTMCRSVGFTDSGELAAVVCTLGIAHPTGYPLFTLLGRIWMMLPLPSEEIVRLNLFSALLTAAAIGLFYKLVMTVHRSSNVFQFRNRKRKENESKYFSLAAAAASLVLGFSSTFWSQSASFEVYALHLVLVMLTTWIFVSGLEGQLTDKQFINRKLILFVLILGLSFSNHMTTILLAPAFLWLYFKTLGLNKVSFAGIIKLSPFFILGLSIYLYLPFRSASDPMLDWGHPVTLERFFWHVSGKQFRIWMFSGWNVIQKQLGYYVKSFPSEYFFLIIPFIFSGALVLLKRSKKLFIFLVVLFVTTIIYSINYDIFDIGSYFLTSYIIAGWLAAYGFSIMLQWGGDKPKWITVAVVAAVLSLPIIQIISNKAGVDESHNMIPQKFVEESIAKLEPNAVVIASQWDYFISPSLYYQLIREKRRDVTIIDKSLLQNRSWYFKQLERYAPWLMVRTRTSKGLFLAELDKFEHDLPLHFNVIQAYWQNLLGEIVEKSLIDRPVYIDARIEGEFPPKYRRIPAGLFLKLVEKEDTASYRSAITGFALERRDLPVEKDFEHYYIIMLLRDADWLARQGRIPEAKVIISEVLKIDPGNISAVWFRKKMENMQ